MGAAGLVLGLATYGYNIMATLGIGIAKVRCLAMAGQAQG